MQSPSPIEGHPLDSCQGPGLHIKSFCKNCTRVSGHLLAVFQASACDLYVFRIFSIPCFCQDLSVKSGSVYFALGM